MYRVRTVTFHSAESRLGRTGKSARATILRDCSQLRNVESGQQLLFNSGTSPIERVLFPRV